MAINKKEWYIIVNPLAGSGKTMSKWVPAQKLLKRRKVPFYTVYTTHKHHASELAATAARMGYRRIMAVGGDGSLHEVFDGVLSWCEDSRTSPEEFYIAVAPIGSGNDWIKAFDVPNDTQKVVKLLGKPKFVREDVARVKLDGDVVSYMANVGGVGFDSHVCDMVNKSKERGKRKARIYFRALLLSFFTTKSINISFYCDGELLYSGPVLDIAFGNGSYCGGGMQQCCLADPSDGILDAVIVPKLSLGSIFLELPRIFKKNLHESGRVIYARGKNFQVVPLDAQSADIVELDGEIVGHLPIEVELSGHFVNVLSGK